MKLLNKLTILFVLLIIFAFIQKSCSQDDFEVHDYQNGEQNYHQGQQSGQNYQNEGQFDQNRQRQMQYLSQRRTACLVLSRYYLNRLNDDIQGIINDMAGQDQQKFINKLYTTAVQKCEPIIQESQVYQFFTSDANFDPSGFFYIFEGYNFNDIAMDFSILTPNQQNILKFIKNFDSQMEIKKQEQKQSQMASEREEGIQLFFIPVKNLPASMKYIYIVIVILICSGLLWWGLSQLGGKPEKKINKRRKKD